MRVLINAASAHMGGAVTYLQNVVRRLPDHAPQDEFVIFAPKATVDDLAFLAHSNVELRAYPYEKTAGLQRVIFDQIDIPKIARQEAFDVVFSSTGFGTFFCPVRQVLLVRNLGYFDPAFHAIYRRLGRSLTRNTVRRWHSTISAKAADLVLFPTEGMRRLANAYFGLPPERQCVLHYGFDHAGRTGRGSWEDGLSEQVERWKAEGYHVLLNVSTYAVHKNFETLVRALSLVVGRGLRVKLLTTISRNRTTDKDEYDALWELIRSLDLQDDVIELGYVPHYALPALYEKADAYVFPSITESFGHTIVEAMASGLPVVASDTAVNREVCEDAGIYFETEDPPACAAAIEQVLLDETCRAGLITAAQGRAREFSWDDYVEQLLYWLRPEMSATSPHSKIRSLNPIEI